MTQRRRLQQLESDIQHADSYTAYYQASAEHDALSGADDWKAENYSHDYDYKLIKKRLERIRFAREHGDAPGLMSILHEGIHGNLGNIANPALTQHCKVGTKYLIQDFLDAVCDALDFIYQADEREVDFYEKLSFFDETAHSYGRSCLMLSGGAGLGFFHCGVIKCLTEHRLLPKVISGASAGAIIAGLVATRQDDELLDVLNPESIHEHFEGWAKWQGFNSSGILDSEPLENALIKLFGLTTFEEAYKKTGRSVTITVSPADLHQYSRLLNSKTSPNAIITQAVRASCAIPYMFDPVKLRAKNAAGEVVPYIPNRKFADGSLMADLPFDRLARLYGVNHSIVSQTNPLAVPFLARTKRHSRSVTSLTMRHLSNLAKVNSVYAFDVLESLTSNKSLKLGIHKMRSIVDQQYVGDINVLPPRGFKNLRYLLMNPSVNSIGELITQAERATWQQLDLIKRSTQISKTFYKCLKQLKLREERLFGHGTPLHLVSKNEAS